MSYFCRACSSRVAGLHCVACQGSACLLQSEPMQKTATAVHISEYIQQC
jgi:hypothetical protein